MADVMAFLTVIGTFGVVLGGLALLARRARRRRISGGYSLMGVFDELWNPASLDARLRMEVHDQRQAPAPAPGDRLI